MRKQYRDKFKIWASPHFVEVSCPVHSNYMIELQNGFLGHPVWYCKECKKIYQLELHAMKKWNPLALEKQLKEIEDRKLKG